MPRIRCILLALMLSAITAFSLAAAEQPSETSAAVPSAFIDEVDYDKTPVDMSQAVFPDFDTQMNYWFLASYDLMMQKKGLGGLLAFGPDMEYVGGYRMDGTPEDFFVNMPRSTLCTPCLLPTIVAEAMYASLGDMESVASLKAYEIENDFVMMISVLKLYETVELEDTVYSRARQDIEAGINAQGLNPDDVYRVYEAAGLTKDDVIHLLIDGKKTIDEIVLDGLRMLRAERSNVLQEEEARLNRIVMLAIGLLAFIGIVVIVLLIISMRSHHKAIKAEESGYNPTGGEVSEGDADGEYSKGREDDQEQDN